LENIVISSIDGLAGCIAGIPITQADLSGGSYAINTPGVYCLCGDLTSSSTIIITISASNVYLNLNGYTLFGGSASSISIVDATDVYVTNGTIQSTTPFAISINGCENITLDTITTYQGGIQINNSQTVLIKNYQGLGANSTVLMSSGNTAIVVQDSSVTGSATAGSPVIGFNVLGVNNVVFDRCTTYSVGTGFSINGLSTLNTTSVVLRDCIAGDAATGFSMTELSTGPVLERCVSTGNTTAAFITTATVTGAEFVECIGVNSTTGFNINGNNILLKRCVATNNDVGITIGATATNVQIIDTCPVNNTATNINNLAGGSAVTFIDLATVEDILLSALDIISFCTCSASSSIISILDTEFTTLQSISDVTQSGIEVIDNCFIGTAITDASLPLSITSPGLYTVCAPLTFDGSPMITVTADNVCINLGGYTLTTDNRAIVCSSATNVTICNGTIQSGLESIVVTSSSNVLLQYISCYQPSDVAISVTSSGGVIIDHCMIAGYNGTTAFGYISPAALYILNSGSVILRDCTVVGVSAGTPVRGIGIIQNISPTGTGGVGVQHCTVQNTTNEGYLIASGGGNLDNIVVANCTASNNSTSFSITHTSGSGSGPVVEQCIAENSTQGFAISATQGTTLNHCIAASNSTSGFSIDAASTQTIISSCISQNNFTGFTVNGTRTTFRWCTAVNNTSNGFDLTSGTALNTVINDCLASRNGGSGLTDGGIASTNIVDCRSQSTSTIENPAYNLNGAVDATASATIVRIS
jgi:hypothetical protein